MGPKQREQHAGGLVVEEYQEVQNGKRVITKRRMRAAQECALDSLFPSGAMGSCDEAAIRMKAAECLRGANLRLHPGTSAQPGHGTGYKSLMYGLHRWSDAQLAQFYQISHALKAVGAVYSLAVIEACCDDVVTRRTVALCKGLDRLSKHRGIT